MSRDSNLNMEEFYSKKLQQQSQQRPQGGSPRVKPSQEAGLGARTSKLTFAENPAQISKTTSRGTPPASSKLDSKLGKSSVADMGVSPKKASENNPSQRKRPSAQMPLDDQDLPGALNGFLNSTKEDSFQKLYSKELDLDEDEVPVILHELNDSAIHFISHEQFERSLSLLQKAQTLLDRLQFQKNPKDRFLIQVTMHNMALCFQKMGALEECALCLDACLHQINSQYLLPKFSGKPTRKLKKIKYECKIHMQVCALLSQLHRHQEALCHAKRAVQISQYLLLDLLSLCEENFKRAIQAKQREQKVHEEQEQIKATDAGLSISQASSKADLIYYDDNISMLERTAFRVYPIIKEIVSKMVKHKDVESIDKPQRTKNIRSDLDSSKFNLKQQSLNMKVLLGYLNQSEWLYLLNIGNIMQITPLTIHDLYSNSKIDVELSRDSILEKISFLAISYFCVSTELRFLVSSKEKLSIDPVQVKAESEFWHGKALEISCGFLPSESPLVTHILSSYQKHHAPVQQTIPEEKEADVDLRVIRPERGIDKSQFQPMIRINKQLNIALSPLSLSPCEHKYQARTVAQPRQRNSFSSRSESASSTAQVNSSNLKHDKRMKNNLVGQTSIEDLNQNNIVLNNNLPAMTNGKSPQSPATAKSSSSSNFDKEIKKEETQRDQEQVSITKPNKAEKVFERTNVVKTGETNKVTELKTLDQPNDTSIDSTNFMLQSLKRIEQRSEELSEMDEAEFITDSRPTRKYETDSTPPEKAQHTKVFLKHEKIAKISSADAEGKMPQQLSVHMITNQVPEKDKHDKSKDKALNQSMMAVPPSQIERKILSQDEEDEVNQSKGNRSVLLQCDQILSHTGKTVKDEAVTDKTEKSRKSVDVQIERDSAQSKKYVKPDKQSNQMSAETKKHISIEQLKEFLKQGKIQIPQSAIQSQKRVKRPQTTLTVDQGKPSEQSGETKKQTSTPKGKKETPRSAKSVNSDPNTSLHIKSDNSVNAPGQEETRLQRTSTSQEKSRSRSKGKQKKVDSAGRNSNQGRPLSRGVGTVPNSNKLTSRGGANNLNNSNNQIENKPRPPSSHQARKLQQQRPDSRRISGNKRRKVLQEDQSKELRRSGSDRAERSSGGGVDCKVADISVDRSQQKSGKGTWTSNYKTFQGRNGANTHHCTTSNSPQHLAQQKPRSSGHIGVGNLNSASQNLIKMANTNGFNGVAIGPVEKPKVKGRNGVVDQSLISSNSLNQSSYVTEGSRLQMIDRSLNVDTQIILDHSKGDSQFMGISQTEVRGRVAVNRPKSKKGKPQHASSSANQKQQQIKNEIMSFLKQSDVDDQTVQKQLLIKKALESQFREGLEVRRKSANTTTNQSMIQGIPHSLSSAPNGFSSLSTATTGQIHPKNNGMSTPMIGGNHNASLQTPNTHSVQLQQTCSNFISQPQGSNSAKRKVLQVTGGTSVFNDARITQTSSMINTQSQKTINLQRLGIQMPKDVNGLENPPIFVDFAHSTQNHTGKPMTIGNQQQVLYNQLLQFQNSQQKAKHSIQALSNQTSQKKFFNERTSPQIAQSQQPAVVKKSKKNSVSPQNGQAQHQMLENYISNQNLFMTSQTNSGVPLTQKPRNQQQNQRINQVAQQQYSTNLVTTQSRKGAQARFDSKTTGQREPTPVFMQEPFQGKKERGTSTENTYAIEKQSQNGQDNLKNQKQTLFQMYQQMKEQKDKEKITKSNFKDDGDLALQ